MKRTVRVGEITLAYHDTGEAASPGVAGEGSRPFVLVHGFSGCRQDFDPVLAELARLGRTLVPDLRGHGESDHAPDPESYRFDTLVADLRGLLDALDVEACDLLGHSMGGMLALRLALAHPERVRSLVLMDTSGRALEIDREAFSRAWALARGAGMTKLQSVLAVRLHNDPARSPADRRCQEAWSEGYWAHHRYRFRAMDPEAYARLGPAMLDCEPLDDRLREIACPTLVLVGEQDRAFRAAADELAREIPGATQVVVPDAEHHPQRENPAAWLHAVRTHLARARGVTPDRGSAARVSRGSP